MVRLSLQLPLAFLWTPIVQLQEIFDPTVYYPAVTYFENQHLPYVPSVGCKELKAVGTTDNEVNINKASLVFTSDDLPTDIPGGQTYAHVEVLGTIVENMPDSYNFHYELFIMCPKCDPNYYINDEPWTTCRTEYESVRSYNQRHGRIVPVVYGQDITLSAYFAQTDFRGCGDNPEIVVKRVTKNNDHQVFGCDTLSKTATSHDTPSGSAGPTFRPSMSEAVQTSGIPPPTMAPTAYYPGCFPMGELVTLDTGEMIGIEDVQVGHRVLSTDRFNRGLKYANVISVPHPYNVIPSEYVHIVTASGSEIRLTPDHLLPVENKANCHHIMLENESSSTIRTAESVSIGDCVYVAKISEHSSQKRLERVISTQIVEGNGLYSIIIDNDFIVFNRGGILASPYNRNHDIATNFYMIFRWLYWMFPYIMQSKQMAFWHQLPVGLDSISTLIISA